MTKETSQPKAVNIIRPNHPNNSNLYNSLSHSSSGSTTSTNSTRRTGSLLSAASTNSARKPRVAGTSIVKSSLEKPILNLYHPPTRKPSYDNNNIHINSKRPPIELYKPPSQQQKMTKSFTAPSLTLANETKLHNNNSNNRPISPSYIRSQSQQQQQQYHRSVLGVINTPVAASTTSTVPSEIVNKSTSSPLIIDQKKPDELILIMDQDQYESVDDELDEITREEIEDGSLQDDEEEDEDDYGEEDEDEGEEPVINEARVNRKIADLELSINSLLTVNAMLEATVRKQALQLSQFKKQRSSGEGPHVDFVLDCNQEDMPDTTDLTANQDEDEDDWENDALFQKLRKVTEHMIEQGQKSIDFEYKILGRVLSNYTGLDENDEDEDEDEDGDEGSVDGDHLSQGTTNNDSVATTTEVEAQGNSNADLKTQSTNNNDNNNSNIPTSKKTASSIPRNINKYARRKTSKSQSINLST